MGVPLVLVRELVVGALVAGEVVLGPPVFQLWRRPFLLNHHCHLGVGVPGLVRELVVGELVVGELVATEVVDMIESIICIMPLVLRLVTEV